jgi:hypothetical protein
MAILTLTSDTLAGTPATGNIEYNGQFFGTDSNAARAQMQRITQGTVQTAPFTSPNTSTTFTGIPSWVKRVTVTFQTLLCSSTSNILIQIGSGSVSSTGYSTIYSYQSNNGTPFVSTTQTNGFQFMKNIAGDTLTGSIVFTNITGNTWLGSGLAWKLGTNMYETSGGTITLGGALDRINLTTVSGTDTFTSGSINILYEG